MAAADLVRAITRVLRRPGTRRGADLWPCSRAVRLSTEPAAAATEWSWHRMRKTTWEAMTVYAEVGNWLVVHGRTIDQPNREGQIVEVPHADGSPPYVVHWLDQDRLSTVFPGPDYTVSPTAPRSAHAAGSRRSGTSS